MRMSSLATSRSAIHVRISLGCIFDVMSSSDGPGAFAATREPHCRSVSQSPTLRAASYSREVLPTLTEVNLLPSIDEKNKSSISHQALTERHKPTTLVSVHVDDHAGILGTRSLCR